MNEITISGAVEYKATVDSLTAAKVIGLIEKILAEGE